jgi:hypothetical protein
VEPLLPVGDISGAFPLDRRGKGVIVDRVPPYNYDRAHQGRNMNGRTPYTVFIEGIPDSFQKEAQLA